MGKLETLRSELEKARKKLNDKGIHYSGDVSNYEELMKAKPFEIAYQDVIERLWPDNAWWEVTGYWDIFDAMMSGLSDEAVIDAIIKHVGKEYINEAKEATINGAKIEYGHNYREYMDKFGDEYDIGILWDFSKDDFESGSIAPRNIVYWYMQDINGDWRYFETNIENESLKESKSLNESLKSKKHLNEGTSNFGHLDYFPLLVFYTMDEFDYMLHNDSDYPQESDFEDDDGNIDNDAYWDAVDTFEHDFWDKNVICVLDEDDQERLEEELYDFNDESKRMAWDADVVNGEQQYGNNLNLEDVELKIEPGYYSAAYIDVEHENYLDYLEDDFKAQQMERFNTFFAHLKKEFGLTKLGVAWGPASNGEIGYKILKDEENESLDEAKNPNAINLSDDVSKSESLKENKEEVKEDAHQDELDLPREVDVQIVDETREYIENDDVDSMDEYLSNYLSDEYGFCHFGFSYEIDVNNDCIHITDIDWDTNESLKESNKVARVEYCVMDKNNNNIECFDNTDDAIAFAKDNEGIRVLEVQYGPKDENGDEPELSAEEVWSIRESLDESNKKYALVVNGEWYSTHDTYEKADEARQRILDACSDEDDAKSYYGECPNIEIKEIDESLDESHEVAKDFSKKDANAIIDWWKKLYNLGKYNIDLGDGKFEDIEGWHAAMFDMLDDLSKEDNEESKELFKVGKKLYNKYAISKYNESLDEKKSKKKYKVNFTGDPEKNAAFFNHAMGSDKGDSGLQQGGTTLGEAKELTRETLNDLCEELYKRLVEEKAYYDLWWDEGDKTVSAEISWGDWKHDHLWFDHFAEKFFKERGYTVKDIQVEETEEDGSDTYSAIHTIYLGDGGLEEGANYSKYAYYEYPKNSGCHVRETPTCFVAINRYGSSIGESETKAGAEGIIDDYLKSHVNETLDDSKGYYYVKYWEDEDLRDIGESEIFMEDFESKEDAIELAKKLIDKWAFASVEVYYTPAGDIDESDDELVWGYDGVDIWGPNGINKDESLDIDAKTYWKDPVGNKKKLEISNLQDMVDKRIAKYGKPTKELLDELEDFGYTLDKNNKVISIENESLKEEIVYGLFAKVKGQGDKQFKEYEDGKPLETGSKKEMLEKKKSYADSWNVNNQGNVFKFFVKEVGTNKF